MHLRIYTHNRRVNAHTHTHISIITPTCVHRHNYVPTHDLHTHNYASWQTDQESPDHHSMKEKTRVVDLPVREKKNKPTVSQANISNISKKTLLRFPKAGAERMWVFSRVPMRHGNEMKTDTDRVMLLSRSPSHDSVWPSSYSTKRQFVCWLVACLTSQQHASVSQGRICTDNFTCCHTEIEAADQTFHLTQSQYTDAGPTSPSADPITTGAWQGSQWSANF